MSSDEHLTDVDVAAREGLEKMGYTQELSRSRGLLGILFMTLAIMAVPFGLGAPLATGLIGGGPATMIWGLVFVALLSLMLAFSLAEICSLYPTSAGAYYWTYKLSPSSSRVLLSWITGWMTLVGNWMAALSVTFGTAQLVVAGAGIYHPEWIATPWQTYVIFLAVTAVASFFCLFFNRHLPSIDVACAWWMAIGLIVMLVALSAEGRAGRHSAGFALGHFDSSASGWGPGWTFFIGLLGPAYTFGGIGMIAAMAEEVHDPVSQLPRAIVYSVPIGAAMGLLFLLPITFTLPDTGVLLAVSSGQPIAVMYEMIMGSKGGGFGMWFIIFGIGIFCSISISCAASRATWAFARDHAIPFSHVFARVAVPPMTKEPIPVNAFLLSTIVQVLIGLIYLGSSTAFNAFVSVAVICLGLSYVTPIAISLARRRRMVAQAPYSLGRWGAVVNTVAVLWVIFEIVILCMPTTLPPTPTTMNYASVVLVAFALFSAVWYVINGRFHYTGPPQVDDIHSPTPEMVFEKNKSDALGSTSVTPV